MCDGERLRLRDENQVERESNSFVCSGDRMCLGIEKRERDGARRKSNAIVVEVLCTFGHSRLYVFSNHEIACACR